MEPLNGKRVLVTGAARRIGREIALRLAKEGAHVIVHFHRSGDDARRTASECGAELIAADLGDIADIRRMFEEAERLTG